RVARICTGRARLEQTGLKKRKKGGGGPRTTTPPVEYVARRKADLLSHPPSGVVLTGNTRPPTNPRPGGVPTREDDGYAIILKPGHTKRGPAYPGNNHTPWKGRAILMQHIGERIREYRMLHGFTQEDLAEK